MKNLFWAFTVSLLFLGCSAPHGEVSHVRADLKNSPGIMGGTIVSGDNTMAKSAVSLLTSVKGKWFQSCSGVIINKNTVLTAAHCVENGGTSPGDILVNFSKTTLSNAAQMNPETFVHDPAQSFEIRQVAQFKIHPYFLGDVVNDIAVIRIVGEIPETSAPADLLPPQYYDLIGKKTVFDGGSRDVTLMGFGYVSENPVIPSTVLRTTIVPGYFNGVTLITDQNGGSGACMGDSGGPAYLDVDGHSYLVGITHGPHKGSLSCHEFGAYLNPVFSLDFIQKAMGKFL